MISILSANLSEVLLRAGALKCSLLSYTKQSCTIGPVVTLRNESILLRLRSLLATKPQKSDSWLCNHISLFDNFCFSLKTFILAWIVNVFNISTGGLHSLKLGIIRPTKPVNHLPMSWTFNKWKILLHVDASWNA